MNVPNSLEVTEQQSRMEQQERFAIMMDAWSSFGQLYGWRFRFLGHYAEAAELHISIKRNDQ